MDRFLSAALLGSMAVLTVIPAQSQQIPNPQPDMKSAFANADFSPLPALPKGKSTILGGQIRNLDPVLDQFTLRIFGERPMKILFDERTQVYRNGVRIPLRDLRPEQHVSVQTALEGSDVFAISIHMLSDLPQGETQGHVQNYNPVTGELTIGSSLTRDPILLVVRPATQVVRIGQSAFTSHSAGQGDLVPGALVAVRFDADEKGRAVADRVTVLARPGSDFAFSGKLSSLDMHSGSLVIVDPKDQKSYQISFDPRVLPISGSLRPGDELRVTATYDGARYTAVDLIRNEPSQP